MKNNKKTNVITNTKKYLTPTEKDAGLDFIKDKHSKQELFNNYIIKPKMDELYELQKAADKIEDGLITLFNTYDPYKNNDPWKAIYSDDPGWQKIYSADKESETDKEIKTLQNTMMIIRRRMSETGEVFDGYMNNLKDIEQGQKEEKENYLKNYLNADKALIEYFEYDYEMLRRIKFICSEKYEKEETLNQIWIETFYDLAPEKLIIEVKKGNFHDWNYAIKTINDYERHKSFIKLNPEIWKPDKNVALKKEWYNEMINWPKFKINQNELKEFKYDENREEATEKPITLPELLHEVYNLDNLLLEDWINE